MVVTVLVEVVRGKNIRGFRILQVDSNEDHDDLGDGEVTDVGGCCCVI